MCWKVYDDSRLFFLRDRLSPLAVARGFDSMLDYYYLLKYDDAASDEWPRVVDALSVQETYFWREADQFQALVKGILPRIVSTRRHAPIRIWSLPCATGEEPLSIAIALTEAGWFDRAEIDLRAADASPSALTKARAGRYGGRAFRQIPEALKCRYFEHDRVRGDWVIDPQIHARVRSWSQINIVKDEELAPLRGCDVLFCRNVFIYFNEAGVRHAVDTFARLMTTPAYLLVGAAESLLRLNSPFELQDVGGAYVYVKP